MKQRVDHVGDSESASFDVPIPAPLLADILGMSEMHTYRMLKRMSKEKLGTFDNGRFELHDTAGLRAAAAFRDDYLLLDKSWLPGP